MANLRSLECLVALVDAGSVTAAAADVHLSQPALSHQIAALERELGTAVVERLGRGVRVTAAGRAAASEARVALRAASRAVEVGRLVGAGRGGRLRIASVETMTAWVLVPVLRHWRSRRPEVDLDLREFTSADRMADCVRAGGADLAIGPRPTHVPDTFEVLGQEEMLVVAPAGHQFAAQRSVSMHALSGEPFVHYDTDNGLAIWVDQLAAKHDVVLQTVLRTRSPRTAAQLAGAGMGVTIVPASALGHRHAGAIKPLRPVVRRDVIVTIAAPGDALAGLFIDDLVQRGLPTVSGQ